MQIESKRLNRKGVKASASGLKFVLAQAQLRAIVPL
jgi:hypothetical protein